MRYNIALLHKKQLIALLGYCKGPFHTKSEMNKPQAEGSACAFTPDFS